ncbi:MAG: HAD family hydrolase [Clostridiales bacterium]|nr:HAD family hydrolase [Clostridiales bacterium]
MNLYITDLDGTLLDEEGCLSNESKESLLKLIESDVMFTVASARSVQSIQILLQDIPLTLPIIAFNGAYISDFETGQHYVINAIEKKIAHSLFKLLIPYGVLSSLHTKGVDALFYSGTVSTGTTDYIRDREIDLKVRVNAIEAIPFDSEVMAFTVIDTKEKILELKEKLVSYDNIIVDAWEDMYYKPWYWLSIHSNESTKANGIKALKDMMTIPVDQLIVFGDNTNDIEMFSIADLSCAVDNAVDSLKNIADEIIGPHIHNSVVRKIADMEGIQLDTI